MKKLGLLFSVATLGLLASCGEATDTLTTTKGETTTVETTTETITETTTETITETTTETTTTVEDEVLSVICPSGTPSLALANYYNSVNGENMEIVEGSDQLIAAFGSKSHDVIVAPVNLGAKFFNTNGNYVLAKTFVWGNLFLASKADLTSFEDIDGKTLTVFGQNSTPDVLTKILIKEMDLDVTIEYVDAVSTANSLLVAGKADYIITAEPSISKIKEAQGINVIDLQEEYSKVTGKTSYPQAGIFIKADSKDDQKVLATVNKLIKSVEDTVSNPETSAEAAVSMSASFEKLGKETLVKAIPNCHYVISAKDDEKAAVIEYLSYMIDLGFDKQVGGKVPGEEFFL